MGSLTFQLTLAAGNVVRINGYLINGFCVTGNQLFFYCNFGHSKDELTLISHGKNYITAAALQLSNVLEQLNNELRNEKT